MGIRAKTSVGRCDVCRLHFAICLCAEMPRLQTRTRVIVAMHPFEQYKTTNSGRLAVACLTNSEILLHGGPMGHSGLPALHAYRPLVLFPDEDAVCLDTLPADDRPTALIVPDGTWRQASKLRRRLNGLAEIPAVFLPIGPPSIYRLRKTPRPGGLSTMEAVARALGLLEGDHVQVPLEMIFRTMIDRLLWMKGRLPLAEVYGGLPNDVARG